MKKNKKRAFTLVELLAVIVILAVILVIAIPRIQHVIENSRKESIASSVKMVAASAETEYAKREALGENTKDMECSDVAKFNNEDYASCTIEFNNGKATVTIIGSGKFKGYSCTGGRNNVECVSGLPELVKLTVDLNDGTSSQVFETTYKPGTKITLTDPEKAEYEFNGWSVEGSDASVEDNVLTIGTENTTIKANWKINGVTLVTNLYSSAASTNGLEQDTSAAANIRYVGASPRNYVTYNNETWRIIGIFSVSNGSSTQERLKIVRNASIGGYSWDSSASTVNSGYGINEWSQADVKTLLNTYYLNQTSGNCYNGASNAYTTCNFSSTSSIKGLDSAANSLIENTVWNTGAITHVTTGISVDDAYTSERGTITGKTCTSGDECNDSVTRTTTWTGKVGLIYPSDYGYASTNTSCRSNIYDTTNNPCQNNNWLHKNVTYYGTITPSSSVSAARSWLVVNAGRVGHADNYSATNIFPVVYLKSSVNVIDGDGTSTSPYQLSL